MTERHPQHKHTCMVGHGVGKTDRICEIAGAHVCECGATREPGKTWEEPKNE